MTREQVNELIKSFKIDIDSALQNRKDLHDLYNYVRNRFTTPNLTCSILIYKDVIEYYVYYSLLEKRDSRKFSEYLNYIVNIGLTIDPFIFFSNPIFMDSTLLNSLYPEKIVYQITEIQKNVNAKIFNIYNKLTNAKVYGTPSPEEIDYIITYFLNTKNNYLGVDLAKKQFIKAVLNSPFFKESLKLKEFILTFFAQENSKKLGIITNIYITDDLKKDSLGMSVNNGIIILNRNVVEKSDFSLHMYSRKQGRFPLHLILEVLFHEQKHSRDQYDASHGVVTLYSLAMIEKYLFAKYLKSSTFDEYRDNYEYQLIEIEANEKSFETTIAFYREYAPDKLMAIYPHIYTNHIEENLKRSVAFKKTPTGNKNLDEIFAVRNLDNIIKNHPEELIKYPQLKCFYNIDGTKKSLEELLNSKITAKIMGDNHAVYDKHIKNCLTENMEFDITMFDPDKINNIISILIDYLWDETKNISSIITVYSIDPRKVEDTTMMIINRLYRIKVIYDILLKARPMLASSKDTYEKLYFIANEALKHLNLSLLEYARKTNISLNEIYDFTEIDLKPYTKEETLVS